MKLHALAFCFLLLSAAVGATGERCSFELFDRGGNYWLAPPTTMIAWAVMFSILAVALVYMAGKVFENERLLTWANDEAFNLGISVLVVVGILAFTLGSCSVLANYAGVDNQFDAAYRYLDAQGKMGLQIVGQLTDESLAKQLDATEYLYIGWVVIDGKGVGIKSNQKAISSHMEMTMDLLLPLIASLQGQRGVLQIIEIITMDLMMPFAIILRLTPFGREAGNLLFAIVFGLYVVVPTMYVLSATAWESIANPQDQVLNRLNPNETALGKGCSASGPAQAECRAYKIGSLIPQAIFIPNLIIVVFVTCTMALAKALRALSI